MFAQHMIASLNDKGFMATVMPHGVLFRGGAEKVIREGIIRANIIEAIISLPPNLFYGTGIPACILVINKNKPKSLENRILFINADAEYGEGRAQNYLRPEDMEKITFVFENKREVPKYSRLVNLSEIKKHEFNLNIRRYVDNSPDPEIEDVHAHLVGGVPRREIALYEQEFRRYSLTGDVMFDEKNNDYCLFKPAITTRSQIKEIIEVHPAVAAENKKMDDALARWWEGARPAIEALPKHNQVAKFRRESIELLKKQFGKIDALDEFQHAGIFVNWWEAVRWDMKTIVSSGWSPSLIPDDYIKNAFFKKEIDEIESFEAKAAEIDSELSELLDGVEMNENGEEENGKTVKAIKSYLKEQVADLKDADTDSARTETAALTRTLEAIEAKDKELKTAKRSLKEKEEQLEMKVVTKRESFTEAEAKGLVLNKFHDLARKEMYRYLNSRKRKIVGMFEQLWNKYQIPLTDLSISRDRTGAELDRFLKALNYLNNK